MSFGQEFLDVTQPPDGLLAVYNTGGSPPSIGRDTNAARFRTLIDSFPKWPPAGGARVPGGVLYLPPGRYFIEDDFVGDSEIDPMDGWSHNLVSLGGYRPDLNTQRADNPFGASVRFREDLTLWLAPGAVLVPATGVIVSIASTLVCNANWIFDLSMGGLVVFERNVPKLLASWWDSGESSGHAIAVQHAIDAGIHNRKTAWEELDAVGRTVVQKKFFDPIPVELVGELFLQSTVEIRGNDKSNHVLELLGTRAFRTPPAFDDFGAPMPIVAGAWSGRARQAARLAAADSLVGPLLRLVGAWGVTIKGIAFRSQGPSRCLDVVHTPPVPPVYMGGGVVNWSIPPAVQGIGILNCHFGGSSMPLVQVGTPSAAPLAPAGPYPFSVPVAPRTNFNADMSTLGFAECRFDVEAFGMAVDIRAGQSLPIRFSSCDFRGTAGAMVSGRSGTALFDRCRFANDSRAVKILGSDPGLEPPSPTDCAR